MFVDEGKDTIYVYMVPGQPGDLETLKGVLVEVLGDELPPEHGIEVVPGKYTFRQLKAWHDFMSRTVLAVPGVVFTDIDDGNNRLEVGIEDLSLARTVEPVLLAIGVPLDAVRFQQAQRIATPGYLPNEEPPLSIDEALPPATLRDMFRPLVGGLQIQVAVKGFDTLSKCTLGFVATRAKISGFVTNDHCVLDHNQLHLDSNIFYQPTMNDNYRVGKGKVDPEFFKPSENPRCPATSSFCRFSDSAFAELTGQAETPVGYIAKPQKGSEWDGKAKFRIVGLVKPVEGMTVTRVSSQSGIDTGKITNPCRNIDIRNEKGRKTGDTLLCQIDVTWDIKVAGGDSGSPVFTTNRENDDVMLLGILWSDYGVSPIDEVKITGTELGPDLLVCATGFEC
jgi:hypothetical protein